MMVHAIITTSMSSQECEPGLDMASPGLSLHTVLDLIKTDDLERLKAYLDSRTVSLEARDKVSVKAYTSIYLHQVTWHMERLSILASKRSLSRTENPHSQA